MNTSKAVVAVTANIESIRVRDCKDTSLLRGCKVAAQQPLPPALCKGVMDISNKMMGVSGKR